MFTVCIWNPPALLKCLVMFGPLTNEINNREFGNIRENASNHCDPQSTVCPGNPNGTLPTTNKPDPKNHVNYSFYLPPHVGVSLNGGTPKTPQNDHFSRKTLVIGYHHFRKPPCRIPVKNAGFCSGFSRS